jgi:very-short-patch-repair endonuclease
LNIPYFRPGTVKTALRGCNGVVKDRSMKCADFTRRFLPLEGEVIAAGDRWGNDKISALHSPLQLESFMNVFFARKLRKNPTEAEYRLWVYLKKRQLFGHKFRRQHPIGPFIVDFACVEQKLLIELDGGGHAKQKIYDHRRTAWLSERGYRVLRFWNNEVLTNVRGVLEIIASKLPPPPATRIGGDLPLEGEDKFP